MKQKILMFLRLFISFGLLILLFWFMRDNIVSIWNIILISNVFYIVFAICLMLTGVLLLAYRLKIIFLGENIIFSFWESLQLTVIGYFFNNFMPTSVGGDLVKAHYAANNSEKKVHFYASVFMDRIIGCYSFLILAVAAVIIDMGKHSSIYVRYIVFISFFIGVLGREIAINKKVFNFVEKFLIELKFFNLGEKLLSLYTIVHDYRNRKHVLLKAFIISFISQAIYFVAIYFFFISLGGNIKLGLIFLIMPIIIFISMLPSVGGLGIREGSMVAFFAPIVGDKIAFAGSLLLLFALILVSIGGAIVCVFWKGTKVKNKLT